MIHIKMYDATDMAPVKVIKFTKNTYVMQMIETWYHK